MIAFTLCSNNYLPYAGVLATSLKANNPGYKFVLGLVDELSPVVNYTRYSFDEIIPVHAIGISQFERLAQQYNIVELNTAVKPFYFEYLLKDCPPSSQILFFDPDIEVFADLDVLRRSLDSVNILLIPHFSTPHHGQRGIMTHETKILQRGLYNLGFIGLKNTPVTRQMVNWWKDRVLDYGYIKPAEGMFTDQKWIDLVPLYFDDVAILKKSGCDVAYWNLYENQLKLVDGKVVVDGAPLIFYHFSAFKLDQPDYVDQLAGHLDVQTAKAIRYLYEGYRQRVLAYDYAFLRRIPYAYRHQKPFLADIRRRVKSFLAGQILN